MNPSQYEEDTVDLVDLFYYLLKKWRSFLAVMVVGLILGVLFSVVKSTVLAYEPKEEDLLKMEQVYQYQLLYKKQLKYNDEAFVTQLDKDGNYVTGELRYYIKAGENTVVLGDIMDITKSENYIDTLRAQLGWKGEERYIRPVISCSFSITSDTSGNITLSESSAANADKTYGVLTYMVRYVEEDDAKMLMAYINDWIGAQNEQYQREYGNYTFEKLTEKISDDGNENVISEKSDAIDAAVEMRETLEEYLAAFSDEQLKYYTENYLGEEVKTGIGSMVKWPVILALVACVLWGIWWVVAYLASGTVRQIDMLTQQYRLPLLGRVESASDKQKGLDGKVSRWADGRKPAPCTPEYLSSALELLPAKEIVLCQTSADPESAALVKELKKHSAKPVCSGVLHTDAGTLSAGKRVGGIFLLVTLEKTKLEELKAELRACELHDLQVLGVVVLG